MHTDNDPSTVSGNLFSLPIISAGQLTARAFPGEAYQEDVEYSSSASRQRGGNASERQSISTTARTQYDYAVKHNPMEFFTDTQNQNCLSAGAICGRT